MKRTDCRIKRGTGGENVVNKDQSLPSRRLPPTGKGSAHVPPTLLPRQKCLGGGWPDTTQAGVNPHRGDGRPDSSCDDQRLIVSAGLLLAKMQGYRNEDGICEKVPPALICPENRRNLRLEPGPALILQTMDQAGTGVPVQQQGASLHKRRGVGFAVGTRSRSSHLTVKRDPALLADRFPDRRVSSPATGAGENRSAGIQEATALDAGPRKDDVENTVTEDMLPDIRGRSLQ